MVCVHRAATTSGTFFDVFLLLLSLGAGEQSFKGRAFREAS